MALNIQKLHVDKMMQQISLGHKNEELIGEMIAKPVTTNEISGMFYDFGKDAFRIYNTARAPGGEADKIKWDFARKNYRCEDHALASMIPDEEVSAADSELDVINTYINLTTGLIALKQEYDTAAMLLNPANYETGFKHSMGGVGEPKKWSDADSTPQLDIANATKYAHANAGSRYNTLVLSRPVLDALLLNPSIIALFSNVQVSLLTIDHLKQVFGIQNIIVGSALKSTAINEADADTFGYIWGKSAFLCYVPNAPSKLEPALAYTFQWNEPGKGVQQVYQQYETKSHATWYEIKKWYSVQVINSTGGVLFADAVA